MNLIITIFFILIAVTRIESTNLTSELIYTIRNANPSSDLLNLPSAVRNTTVDDKLHVCTNANYNWTFVDCIAFQILGFAGNLVHHNPSLRKLGSAQPRPCDFLYSIATPHCCEQLCKPAGGGKCDWTGYNFYPNGTLGLPLNVPSGRMPTATKTGACFCQGEGVPNLCGVYTGDNAAAIPADVKSDCQRKCSLNPDPNGCKTPGTVNDGEAYVCVCYCPPSSTTQPQ